ncbi:hypothetical protein INR49_020879 [Caranx melampygus]|nr:hypothetical protein INR49_020879 [Caranx melampygus]
MVSSQLFKVGGASGPEPTHPPQQKPYLIGVGRADCTGPPAEIPLMGYANPQQTAAGIHTRLYSRAFIIDDGMRRVVFVTADVGMISQRLRLEVLQVLQQKYGDLYRQDNVVLSGTHTHCGPAGYFQYTLFMISSKGYIKDAIRPLVDGIVKVSSGHLDDSSLNRSPQSYLNNPKDERHRYKENTDKQVVVLKFTDMDGDGIGMISWFAVHAVSMNYTNRLVSSDNMGYASYLLEQDKNPGELPGQGGFVAGFSSSNLGDVSPNTRGPHCVNTGLPCDYLNSSCPVGGELQVEGAFRDVEVVIAGLSNVYTHYITTYEEYQVQRYEGASTIYGPHTLTAYLHKYRGLARAIAQCRSCPPAPPPFFTKNLFNLLSKASVDRKPDNSSFGDVLQQVYPVYRQGDVVSVSFVAGNPRHSGDIRDKTFVTVEIYDNRTETWEIVHTDASWETRFQWLKGSKQLSNATVQWYIPASALSGSYRIRHFGHYKQMKGLRPVITPYEGISDIFTVTSSFYY